jgi:hypothetical protein
MKGLGNLCPMKAGYGADSDGMVHFIIPEWEWAEPRQSPQCGNTDLNQSL